MTKLKKCSECPTEFPRSGMRNVCSIPCSIARIERRRAERFQKECNVAKKKYYDKDLNKQIALTIPVFNKLRRLQEFKWFKDRGLEPECISCGKKKMDWCCSHFKTAGSHSELQFDPMNTYLACNRYCNSGLSGNIDGTKTTRGYKVGLAERFGQEEADRIIEYCNTSRVKKWTCEELIVMRASFNKQIRELEHGNE